MVVLGKILPIAFAGLALLFIGNAIARPVMAQQTAGALTSTGIGIGESLGSVGQGISSFLGGIGTGTAQLFNPLFTFMVVPATINIGWVVCANLYWL